MRTAATDGPYWGCGDRFLLSQRKLKMRLTAAMQWRSRHSSAGNAAHGCGRCARLGAYGALLTLLAAVPAAAQAPPAPKLLAQPVPVVKPQPAVKPKPAVRPKPAQHATHNRDTLIVAASRPGASYLAMADDLGASLGTGGSVRLLPVAADGGLANLRDVLFLRGIDMAIVPANVLAHAKTTKALGGGLARRMFYITALYGEEVHVVAGQGIATIGDLRGKKVAVPSGDGTVRFTASDIFQRLGVAIDMVPMSPAQALAEVRSGAVAAAVLVAGKPVAQVSALPKDGRLRLLALPSATLPGEGYSPAVLLAEDYPALIPPGAIVETVAVRAVLVTGKGSSETARRVARHTPALLDAIARLAVSQPRSKWKDVNVGAVLPGWSRVEAAERWLDRASERRKESLRGRPQGATLRAPPPTGKRIKSTSIASQRKKLFDDFDVWARQSAASQPVADRFTAK